MSLVFNRSLGNGYIPASQKVAIVKPLLKKQSLDKEDQRNFRPVSNLTFNSKLMERIVGGQLTDFLESNGALPENKISYWKFHSIESILLKVYSDLNITMVKGHVTLLGLWI